MKISLFPQVCKLTRNLPDFFSHIFSFLLQGMDGLVLLTDITRNSTPGIGCTVLTSIDDMGYKCFFKPDDPYVFTSTSQDGLIRLFDLRVKKQPIQTLLKFTRAHVAVSVNSMCWHPLGNGEFVVGGADPFVKLYDLRKVTSIPNESGVTKYRDLNAIKKFAPKQIAMNSFKKSMSRYYVTGVDYNIKSEILINYSRDDVYLFSSLDVGNTQTNDTSDNSKNQTSDTISCTTPIQRYSGRKNIQTFLKEVAFVGNNQFVATGSDDGNLYIWEKTSGRLVRRLKGGTKKKKILFLILKKSNLCYQLRSACCEWNCATSLVAHFGSLWN